MFDLQQIENSYLPIDKLIHDYRISLIGVNKHKQFTKYNNNKIIFHSYITLPFIMEPEIKDAVRKYITDLIINKEEFGYLYFLNIQKLIIPLHLNFNEELVVDPNTSLQIKKEIHALASQFSCETADNLFFLITQIEILYFLTILVNPHLNWITVDYILRGNKTHDYLISSKDRIIQKTWPTSV